MKRYSLIQISLHWLIALLIFAAFGLIWYYGDMQITSPATFKAKAAGIAWHKWAGMSVLILFLLRLVVRVKQGSPAPLAGQPKLQLLLAAGAHHLLYLLMAIVPLMGWLMSSAKGYPVKLFNLVQLPDLVAKSDTLAEQLEGAHVFLAYTLLVIVGLHAAAALKHHFIDRDATLLRMLPGGNKGENQA
ncbi:cytochrome b561 [Andreprevotia lacus DSM 23236]|jgi:cytochrome b561|uniref:Cytochrome b561 n=1 Tax=Andreprevotia lacus DSM 23236 TaxID=1121001 RepID=A0A1W1XR18_9NEIS|nr:cytochrome b [Andreprevotia lacus]SMC26295.1 cytochrome b561 [Andreprevotia lacus DSM 23236]